MVGAGAFRTLYEGPLLQRESSNDHVRNFLDCIKSRGQTVSDIDAAVSVDTVCHLSDIATQLERKLAWDPKCEQFVNNETANRLLVRAMRIPWHL